MFKAFKIIKLQLEVNNLLNRFENIDDLKISITEHLSIYVTSKKYNLTNWCNNIEEVRHYLRGVKDMIEYVNSLSVSKKK